MNLTSQGLKEIWQKYQQMKAQGVGEENAEYANLHGILSAVQRDNMMAKHRIQAQQQIKQQQYQMQQQQQQQQQQNHVVLQSNAAPASTNTNATLNGVSSSAIAQNSAPQPLGQSAGSKPGGAPNNFSAEQLRVLRNQIFAFKLLSKNLGVPTDVQQQLFASQLAQRSPSLNQIVTAANDAMDDVTQAQAQAQPQDAAAALAATAATSVEGALDQSKPSQPRNRYDTFTDPYSRLRKTIPYAEHAMREQRVIIPSIMPTGIDADRIREERERVIYNRIMTRKAELEKLPSNLAVWDASNLGLPSGSDSSLKLKALLEYKMLCQLPRQRKLRERLTADLIHQNNLSMTSNRSMYRRMKKQSLKEAHVTETLEKQQRDARENREKKKHEDYLKAVMSHAQEVQTTASNRKNRLQKLGRMMQQHHVQIEKDEQKRIERTAKQRLLALKSNDEEAYFKLLDRAKDTRITHLLKQTDGFLKQLAASVRQQQRSAAERYGDKDYADDDVESEDEDDEAGDSAKVDYYEVAHRVKEEVTVQPNILVGGTLKEYQIKGLQWMISLYNNQLNGILADEMGLGKTIQTISLITYLVEKKNQNGPFLVIVPLSTLTNWTMEFEKWAPSISRIVYKGPPLVRKQQQSAIRHGNFQVLLTTYDFIIKDRPVLSKIRWTHMIVDEGHRMKNAKSKLSYTLTTYYTSRYRLILTGTPLQNNLPELWALLNFVLPNIFKSVTSFDEWFNTPFANTGGQDKMELTEEEQLLVIKRLHKVLRPFLLRRLKKDVEKDLPEKQERVIKCLFSALQAKLYKQMMTDQKIMVGDGKGGKTGIRGLSNMLMQLRKLCNHPFVFNEVEDQINQSHSIDDLLWRTSGKFELLDRILPKFLVTGHRVLMFFQMTNIMNIMEDYMRLKNMQYLRLDGTTKADDRSELLKAFNAPNSPYFCFLLSTRAGGLGLNLQTADTVVIFDSDWNPHQDLQAQDRAHRIGQKNEVRILRLISSNSVEEKILERAQYKLDMDGKVIQAGKFDNKSTNEEREQMLRTLMEAAEATETLDQEEMDDDDLNEIMARSDDELKLFQQMDQDRERDSPYGPGKPYPRLLCEAELPDIYLNDSLPVAEEVEEVAGRGARQRTQVKYDDGLTEEQWLEAVDADDDTIEEAVARKQARIAKRQANKDKRGKGGAGTATGTATATASVSAEASPEPPTPSRDSSEQPMVKRRARKNNQNPSSHHDKNGASSSKAEKRKAEDAALDEPGGAAFTPSHAGSGSTGGGGPNQKRNKRGRFSKAPHADPMHAQRRAIQQQICQTVHKGLMELEAGPESDEEGDGGGRAIIDPFVALPSKKLYPDYYLVIPHPVSMDQIKKRIHKDEYHSIKDFRDDVLTLCNNARTYNEDGSLLFQDANTIERECLARLKAETDKHPDVFARSGSVLSLATAAGDDFDDDRRSSVSHSYSHAATPLPAAAAAATPGPGPGPGTAMGSTKIKLNLGVKGSSGTKKGGGGGGGGGGGASGKAGKSGRAGGGGVDRDGDQRMENGD
ncbi:MAG: hypothetical protein M1826_005531 [Phylliscum demangeonii]|nr:MAG: hypothetical protein M1826_005531 [Phylliscum demangeonii]